MENCIDIHNLSLQYKGTDFMAVDGLSLTIEKGEVFGLFGPNGAGKTSLISMMTGLIPVRNGKISINGLDVSSQHRKIKGIIGVVPQEYALYPKLTAKENLMFFGSMYGINKSVLEDKVNKGIEKMGLTKFARKKIATYSGGMKRRINLLAGVLHQPEIIFLDEPTVGVDVHSKRVIMDYLHELNKQGITIIYSSHLLFQAQNFCTRIAIIDSGKLQVEGPTKKILFNNGKLKSLEEIFIEHTEK